MYKKGCLWLIVGLSIFILGVSLLLMMGWVDMISMFVEK